MFLDCRAQRAGKMWTTLTPVQAWSAAGTPTAISRIQQNTCFAKHAAPGLCYDRTVSPEFDHACRDKSVGDGDPEFAGQMIVTGPRPPKRRVDPRHRPANIRRPLGGEGHYAFKHACDVGRRQTIIAMPALCDDL